MADDLEEEWWLQNKEEKLEFDSDSGKEQREDNEEINGNRKRKMSIDEIEGGSIDGENTARSSNKKKKKRKKITDELKDKVPESTKPEFLLDAINKYFKDKLSSVEQDELQLHEDKDFHVCSSTEDTATSYLRTVLPKWKKLVKKNDLPPGSPVLLIVTSSAIRAVQLNREIKDFKGEETKCAKLFAKHFKLEDQQKHLSKNICHMGIGTPNRLHTLLKSDSLHLEHIKSIIIDWNWRDIKSKRLIDIPEIKTDFMKLLQTYLVPHTHHTKCKIGLL